MTLSRRDFLIGATAVAATIAMPVVVEAKASEVYERHTFSWPDTTGFYSANVDNAPPLYLVDVDHVYISGVTDHAVTWSDRGYYEWKPRLT